MINQRHDRTQNPTGQACAVGTNFMDYDKNKFTDRLKKRVPLRLHMTLILVATGISGLLTTRLLLAAGVESIVIRYPLAVLFSYLIFFLLIKLWLKYLQIAPVQQIREKKSTVADVLSNFDIPTGGGSGGSIPDVGGHFSGGGGLFSGGGASGGFDDMGVVITEGAGNALSEAGGSAGVSVLEGSASAVADHGSGVIGDVAEGAASALGDEGGLVAIVVMAIIGAVVAVVIGAGVYMVYEAPVILSEAAFEVVLAASLVRSSRTMNDPDWIGSVFRATWKPFGISLLVALVGALVIHSAYPHVTRVSELVRQLMKSI
jgi:hypothetical protein